MFYRIFEEAKGIYYLSSFVLITVYILFFIQASTAYSQIVSPAQIYIQPEIPNTDGGEVARININFSPGSEPFEMTAFKLLLSYDTDMLTINSITPGKLLDSCQWEIFTYSQDSLADCGEVPCPNGMIRIVSIADSSFSGFPLCNISTEGALVNIDFTVTSDSSYSCFLAPIDFYWYDCTDNSVSSITADTLFISKDVYQGRYEYQQYNKITKDTTFPTPFGASSECTAASTTAQRSIDFISYGVEITCIDSIDTRGDINLNNLTYELADAVIFSNYFIFGLDAFTIDPEQQTYATDINNDGLTLTLDDYVYLWRVILGDVLPYPTPPTFAVIDTVLFVQDTLNKKVSYIYPDSLRAVYLIFEGDLRPWGWGDDSLDAPFPFDGTHTRVLIDKFFYDTTIFSQDSLFSYTGEGKLVGAFASYDGLEPIPTAIKGGSGSCCVNRGNVNGDLLGQIDISDLVSLVFYIFTSGTVPSCLDEADISGDWNVDIADIIFFVNYLFRNGPLPLPCQ